MFDFKELCELWFNPVWKSHFTTEKVGGSQDENIPDG